MTTPIKQSHQVQTNTLEGVENKIDNKLKDLSLKID